MRVVRYAVTTSAGTQSTSTNTLKKYRVSLLGIVKDSRDESLRQTTTGQSLPCVH